MRTVGQPETKAVVPRGPRNLLSRGLVTVVAATGLLFLLSELVASSSVTRGTLLTMLPFASALAIAGLGQTLVVMQGGIDLSIAGGLSLYVVIVTKYPAGVNGRLWPAIGIAIGAAIAAGLVNGFLIGRMRLNPIARAATSVRGGTGSAPSTNTSSGSPSSASVWGMKP